MTSYLFHCGTDGCCWLPLEPNVTALDTDGTTDTVTVRCPVCTRTDTYPVPPGVHLAVYRHREALGALAGSITTKAEAHLRKEAGR